MKFKPVLDRSEDVDAGKPPGRLSYTFGIVNRRLEYCSYVLNRRERVYLRSALVASWMRGVSIDDMDNLARTIGFEFDTLEEFAKRLAVLKPRANTDRPRRK